MADATGGAVAAERPVVRTTDFTITYRLEGQTADGDAVQLLPDDRLSLASSPPWGSVVARGAALGEVVVDAAARAELEAAAATSRISAASVTQLDAFTGPLTAPVTGTVERGPSGPVVTSAGVDVVVDLTPLQALRYRSLPFSGQATVESVVGQRTTTCAAVWTERLDQATEAGSADRLHCRVPPFVETVSGLRAGLVLTSRTIESATVVPNVALRYDASTDGYSVVVDRDGAQTTVPVAVGATDGVVRVVDGDLPEGAPLVLPEGAGA